MGGYGSGQQGGRPTVENAWRVDIDTLVRAGAIKPGAYVEGNLNLPSCDDELAIEFESSATGPGNNWLLPFRKSIQGGARDPMRSWTPRSQA